MLFSFQAHDTSVRVMKWSHNDQWMLTADHAGFVKYWQSNMNNVKMYQAHKDPIRGLRYAGPTAAGPAHAARLVSYLLVLSKATSLVSAIMFMYILHFVIFVASSQAP